jgi:hypothetical protein
METAEFLRIIFGSLVYQLPIFIVLSIGIIYCIITFFKHPKTNRWALGGLLVMFALDIVNLFNPVWNIYFFRTYGSSGVFGYITYLIGFVLSMIFAVGLGMILYAIWANRTPQ